MNSLTSEAPRVLGFYIQLYTLFHFEKRINLQSYFVSHGQKRLKFPFPVLEIHSGALKACLEYKDEDHTPP